jgi:hypothetical protein
MVKETKAALECRVTEVKPLGRGGGAANLVICEVLLIHVAESALDEDGRIDPAQLNLVARLGGDKHTVVRPRNMFTLPRPSDPVGLNALPGWLQESPHFTGNEQAALASIAAIPDVDPLLPDERLQAIAAYTKGRRKEELLVQYAKELLQDHRIAETWQLMLALQPAAQPVGQTILPTR